ncbi:probable BOI-related E3 ubiquitin-protein ligase 3 [Rutidosis leptorrhynchoides]|uniref:probable BOI-related E3 ubiquitin-protein ligase 3 n=1 Tax=Rutidosis leptorrhynchoides TaxID=125765 RepID=UPI003A98EABF
MIDDIHNHKHSNQHIYNTQLPYNTVYPLCGTTTPAGEIHTLLPMYSDFTHSLNPDPLKSDSGLTYSLPVSKKRSRDVASTCPYNPYVNRIPLDRCNGFTFLGEDISSQIHQHEFEIDQFVSHHIEKVRVDIEDRRKRNSRTLLTALEETITDKLRAKEDEITKISKLNLALEEKLKSMCIENQMWRELAMANESTVNTLRGNLKQVLEQVVYNDGYGYRSKAEGDGNATVDDAQSCCESNGNERMLAEQDSSKCRLVCKSCWKGESCVLLLPCRHLCLCTVCGSSVDICPICKSPTNISVHVHMV